MEQTIPADSPADSIVFGDTARICGFGARHVGPATPNGDEGGSERPVPRTTRAANGPCREWPEPRTARAANGPYRERPVPRTARAANGLSPEWPVPRTVRATNGPCHERPEP